MSLKLLAVLPALGAVLVGALIPVIPTLSVRMVLVAVALVMLFVAGIAIGAGMRGARFGERRS